MANWHRVNMSALTWGEVRRFAGGNPLEFLALAVLKLLRLKGPLNLLFQRSDVLATVQENELPADQSAALRAAEEELLRADPGFRRLALTRPRCRGTISTAGIHALSADGRTIVALMVTTMKPPGQTTSRLVTQAWFASELGSGLRVLTGNSARRFESPPGSDSSHLPGATIADVLRAHVERLDRLGRTSTPKIHDAQQALAAALASEQRSHDFHVARGVYVPATVEEMMRFGGGTNA